MTLAEQGPAGVITAWRRFGRAAPHIAVLGLILLLLLPRSAMLVAARIGYEMHVVSFLLGPATYAYGDKLLPGVDYFTQYSVGFPWLFSWLLDGSADHAVLGYVRLMVAVMVLFYWGLYGLLCWLLGSWRWALGTTLTVLILQFHVDRTFFDPSSYVLRYPLLVATVAAIALWIARGQRASWALATGSALGASLFLNSETGLYQVLAVAFVSFFASRGRRQPLLASALCLAAGFALFALLCGVAFGSGAFSPQFVAGLLEPFGIYSGGFGGWAIDWRWGWQLLYNVVAPGLALATMAWAAQRLWMAGGDDGARARVAALATFSALGILMSAKYSNMSIVALWHVSALGFLVTIAWWARQVQLMAVGSRAGVGGWRPATPTLVGGTCAIAATLLVTTANDPRNPALYGLHAYLRYPAVLNPRAYLRRDACARLDCAAPRIQREDVAMIERLVPKGARAAVFGWNDWAYLIEARRASWFHFLPSQATFTRAQLAAAARMPDILFLPNSKDPDLGIKHPELSVAMLPVLKRDYEALETGRDLVAWQRKSAAR